jgi:hypothetical protein
LLRPEANPPVFNTSLRMLLAVAAFDPLPTIRVVPLRSRPFLVCFPRLHCQDRSNSTQAARWHVSTILRLLPEHGGAQ